MVWSNTSTTQIVIPPGATSGQRIIIDQNGIIMYDSNNLIIFAIALQGFNRGQLESGAITLTDNGTIGSLFEFYGPGNNFGSDWYYSAGASGGFAQHNIGFPNGFSQSRLTIQFWPGIFEQYNLDALNPKPFGYRFSSADPGYGAYYHEEYVWSAGQTIAAGTDTTLKYDHLDQSFTDHGNNYNTGTGVWTAPVDGIYSLQADLSNAGFIVTSGRVILEFINASTLAILKRTEYIPPANGNVGISVAIQKQFFAKGTTILARVENFASAFTTATTYNNRLIIHRDGT